MERIIDFNINRILKVCTLAELLGLLIYLAAIANSIIFPHGNISIGLVMAASALLPLVMIPIIFFHFVIAVKRLFTGELDLFDKVSLFIVSLIVCYVINKLMFYYN